MNVNDVIKIPKTNNYLEAIFKRQIELAKKYHDIEHSMLKIHELHLNFTGRGFIFSIDDPVVQFKVKDYLWRITEEIAESFEVDENNEEEDKIHQIEELSDALHFMVEMFIFCQIDYKELNTLELEWEVYDDFGSDAMSNNESMSIDEMYLDIFYSLGMIGNCLKNKPWKKTQMRTDLNKFKGCCRYAYSSLIQLFYKLYLHPEDIYEIYIKKSEVNKFRQKTKY